MPETASTDATGTGAHDCDVLVVGCGPVGVMTALLCARRGLDVVAVDRSTEIFPYPRAIGMDDEIQRIFQQVGLLGGLEAASSPVSGAQFTDADGNRLIGFDLPAGTVGALGLPVLVMFEQPQVEALLREAAAEAGVELRLGVAAGAVDLDAGVDAGATVTTHEVDDGTEGSISSRWLIGADGASSTVRHLAEIDVVDQGFDQEWLVVDATLLDPAVDFPTIPTQVCSPDRVVTLIPGHRTRRRWEFQLREGETADEMGDPDRIAELLAAWGSPRQVQVDRAAVYRFHATVSRSFRRGPLFLAGDAAHQMPPFNGQGMCTGMRDAQNLAWKLAMVHRGDAGDTLLDTYEVERRPHATAQVEHSADAGRLIDTLAAGADVDTAAGYGGGRPFPHLEHGLLDGDHPAVGRPLPQPAFEGRPLDEHLGDGFALLSHTATDPGAASWWTDRGAVTLALPEAVLDDVFGPAQFVVVRPDRYVAAVTEDLAATTRRLATTVTGRPT